MTEIMVHHTLLKKSFSFTGSKFDHIQTSNEGEMSTIQNSELKENFSKKLNEKCDNFIEATEPKSDKDDCALSDGPMIEGYVAKRAGNSSRNLVQVQSNVSNDDYKVLATKTTVINTTYNLITKSSKRDVMNMTTNMEHSPWPGFSNVITEAVDKSRVIVQVLKSDMKYKSQNVTDSKSSNPESQSMHSFRDDLCKLLSKSQSSKLSEGESSDSFPSKDTLDASNFPASQDVSSESHQSKTHTVKARRKQNLNFYFWNGRGTKIGDLKCVCDNLREANPASLRYLHYLMFNSFGLCGTALQLLETKKNIKRFCGYPFKRSSEQFQKKLKCISNIPRQILEGIHRALFGKTSVPIKPIMVDQVINFLRFPRKCSEVLKKYGNKIKCIPEDEYTALKESALKGPALSITLERLPEDILREYDLNESYEMPASEQNEDTVIESISDHTLPAFILNGPGAKLKHIARISKNVRTVHEKPIKILHYILYGRIEPNVSDCRRNILEFNGFSDCQKEFASERKDIIMKLHNRELFELCKILCIRAKTSSREIRIKKILKYLQLPTEPDINKSFGISRWAGPISSRSGQKAYLPSRPSFKNVCRRKKYSSVLKSSESKLRESHPHVCHRKKYSSVLKSSESKLRESHPRVSSPSANSDFSEEVFTNDDGWKLKNFKTVLSNIECAASVDLIELNDLLFFKTCDESDIHQKILDFSGFNFPVNSIHYESRKTLMHYMGFCIVRKIARLLNIENWEKIPNLDDLSTNVLKFLMSDSPCSNSSSPFKSVKDRHIFSKSLSTISPKCAVERSDAGSSSPSSLLEICSNTNSQNPKSLKPEIHQHANKTITHQKEKVIIQRLTKASVQNEEVCESTQSVEIFKGETQNLPCVNASADDSICLRDLIHHPSEQELKDLISHLVKDNMWCFTLGDLVQKVYTHYPKVDLSYRESFIKTAARQMVSELRDYAVAAVKYHTL